MVNRSEQYNNLAYYYDMLMYDVNYDAWSEYIVDILERYDIKYNDLLEMACGTGSMSVRLAKKGYNVTAFDLSPDMLSVASSKSDECGTDVRLLCQDMRDIKISETFGIIICLCDSINYISSTDELSDIFKWVYSHLKPGGAFIFDINSSYKLRNVIGNNTFTYNEDDIVYIWDNYLNENIVEFYLNFFIRQGTLYRRFEEMHIERIYEANEIVNMLKDAGFNDIHLVDAFTFEEPVDTSERINFIVKK